MPKKERKEAKAAIRRLQTALDRKVQGYKSVSASARDSPVAMAMEGADRYRHYGKDDVANGVANDVA